MSSNVDVFKEINRSKVLAKPGHLISCFEDSYDSPSTYSAKCSCGWNSIAVSQYVPDWPLDPRLVAFREKYGYDVLLFGKGVSGSSKTVVREVLAHLDLPLEAMIHGHMKLAHELVQQLVRNPVDESLLEELSDLAKNVRLLEAAETIVATVEIPVPQPVPAGAREEYAVIRAEIYPSTPISAEDLERILGV